MSMRRRGPTRRRLDPDEYFGGGEGGANGIPAWENPAAVASSSPPAKQSSRRLPPRTRSSSKSMLSSRSSNSDLGQHVGVAPAVSPEPKQLHQDHHHHHHGRMIEPQLENIVIECDYSDMSSDMSGYDDNGTFAEDTESRGNNSRRLSTKPAFRPRRPQLRPDVILPDHPHPHEHRDPHYPRQPVRRQASSSADIEAEERKLIEMAMERSLQESSSLMSVSYQSHERGCPSAASSASSLIDMQNVLRPNDAETKAAAGGRKGWKRDGKKWARMPMSSHNGASNTVQPEEAATSAYLKAPMTREERLTMVEEQMFHEAMRNSVRDLHVPVDDSSQAPKQQSSSYPQQQHPHHSHHNDMADNEHDELHDVEYSMNEQAALERLEELERERRRIENAMVRRRSSRGLQRTCSGDSSRRSERQTSYRDHRPSSGGSFHERDASWEGNDCRPVSYDAGGRRDSYRESSTGRASAGYRSDAYDRRQQYHDQHNISLESLSFRNNEQLDNMHEHQQQPRSGPVRKSPSRAQSYDLMSANSREPSGHSDVHRFHQSCAHDSGSSSLGPEGQKYVWKRGPNKAWGRYPESDHDEEDEDAIFADVLARSMHER